MKQNNTPSLHSPKNKYRVEVHFTQPLEGLGSVVSFGTMSLDGIDDYIRRHWMYGKEEVHIVIRENMKTYPSFDWKKVRDEKLNAKMKYTYDVVFNDDTNSNSKGFCENLEYCKDYIRMNNGTNESYFEDYKGGSVQIVCNETEEVVCEENVI